MSKRYASAITATTSEQTYAFWAKRFIHCHNTLTRKPTCLSVVMTHVEVRFVLTNLTGDKWLMAPLQCHLKKVKVIHEKDLSEG